jgi:hypothetical protein
MDDGSIYESIRRNLKCIELLLKNVFAVGEKYSDHLATRCLKFNFGIRKPLIQGFNKPPPIPKLEEPVIIFQLHKTINLLERKNFYHVINKDDHHILRG